VNGSVVSIQLLQAHGEPLRPVPETIAVPGRGLEGDLHGKTREDGRRQVLLVEARSLQAMGLSPGDLREQITVDLPGLHGFPLGTRLRVGKAELELSGPCEPCHHIGELLGLEDRETFRQSLEGRRGVLARVVSVAGDGRIRVGDPAEVLPAAEAQPAEAR
jgi:MOSC domain-containing protein YiiM